MIQERDLKSKELEDQNVKLAETAKELGYKLYLENLIAGDADAAFIRKVVGDVKSYSSAKELEAKVEALRAEVEKERSKREQVEQKLRDQKTKEEEKLRSEQKKKDEEVEELQGKLSKMQEALEKSLEANKAQALKVYAESRLTNHPKAAKIRRLIEASAPSSREEVDELFENFREPALDPTEMETVRSRVRKLTKGGEGPSPIDEERTNPRRPGSDALSQELGVPVEDLRKLSGIGR
jgi:DNA anti-recombination protein RmuC